MPPGITSIPSTTFCFCFGKHLSKSFPEGLSVLVGIIFLLPWALVQNSVWTLCPSCDHVHWVISVLVPRCPWGIGARWKNVLPVQLMRANLSSHPNSRKLRQFPETFHSWKSAWASLKLQWRRGGRNPHTLEPRVRGFHPWFSGTKCLGTNASDCHLPLFKPQRLLTSWVSVMSPIEWLQWKPMSHMIR